MLLDILVGTLLVVSMVIAMVALTPASGHQHHTGRRPHWLHRHH